VYDRLATASVATATSAATATWATSATTATEATSTTTLSRWALAGDINHYLSSLNLGAIEHINCSLSLFRRRHLNEPEASLPTGRWVEYDTGRLNFASWCKVVSQLFISHREWEISYIQLFIRH
jgi:hypothetical protein